MLLPKEQRLESIQILRAVAALLVLFAHTWPSLIRFGAQDQIPNFILGAVGVDLFFVISGFIMVYASERLFGRPGSPREFLTRRLIRIVPLYWLLTTVIVVVVYRMSSQDNATWTNILGSYLFIPTARPAGTTEPILGVGWTLNHEMFFYAAFACVLPLRRWLAVPLLTVALVGLIYVPMPQFPPLSVWASPFLFEFVFGMWVAMAMRAGLRIPPWLSVSLILIGVSMMIATDASEFRLLGRTTGWGLSAAMIVAAVSLANTERKLPRVLQPVVLLGEASYALYLVHSLIPGAMTRLSLTDLFPPISHPWIFCTLFFSLSITVAVALHLIEEHCRRAVLAYMAKPRLATA